MFTVWFQGWDAGTREGSTEMTTAATTKRLAAYEQRYRDLAAQIADVGFIAAGSVIQRSTRCGTPTCRCHADPPQMHGPYWQWTAKVDGKTVTRRLTAAEAALYQEWIANDRHLRSLIAKMRAVAAKATALALKTVNQPAAKV
jgi:hypothetical protein